MSSMSVMILLMMVERREPVDWRRPEGESTVFHWPYTSRRRSTVELTAVSHACAKGCSIQFANPWAPSKRSPRMVRWDSISLP